VQTDPSAAGEASHTVSLPGFTQPPGFQPFRSFTDKKENKIFLINKEIQKGAVANSNITNGLLIFAHLILINMTRFDSKMLP
jgi:hypothetical protein